MWVEGENKKEEEKEVFKQQSLFVFWQFKDCN